MVADRIEGRKWAEEILDSIKDLSEDYRDSFWRAVKRKFELKKKKKIDSTMMSDDESKAFGRSVVEFGKYRGRQVDEVPIEYWEWLADENLRVQRYLRSRRIVEEREE